MHAVKGVGDSAFAPGHGAGGFSICTWSKGWGVSTCTRPKGWGFQHMKTAKGVGGVSRCTHRERDRIGDQPVTGTACTHGAVHLAPAVTGSMDIRKGWGWGT